MKRIILTAIALMPLLSPGQVPAIDSLKNVLIANNSLSETKRIDVLNALAYNLLVSDPTLALTYATEAASSAKLLGYKAGEGAANVSMGYYHWIKSEYEKSLEHALSALNIFEADLDKKGMMNTSFLLGITYTQLNDSVKSESSFQRTFTLATDLDDKPMMAKVYNSWGLAVINDRLDHQEAMRLYAQALELLQDDDSYTKVLILANIASVHRNNNDFDKAHKALAEARQLATQQNNIFGLALIYLQLGCAYMDAGDHVRAETHFRTAVDLSKRIGVKRILLNTYISIIDLKLREGNSAEAHKYQMKYAQVRDSIFNAERAQKIAELEARFETQKKEKAIEELEEANQVQLIWRNVLVIGVLLTALVSYYIYGIQRSKALKVKQLLEVQRLFNEKLKELDKLKSNFFANISHELRTPLTLILAPLEEELKMKAGAEKESLILMKRNANRLLELVNQLLDLSKLEAGKMQLHVRHECIGTFLQVLGASFDSLAQTRKITFTKQIETGGQPIWFDQDKIEKIVNNLLSNAFKFTPAHGTVALSASLKEKENGTSLTITVKDSGAGISPEEQENIFQPFYQAGQSLGNKPQGTGLGLSIVKEIVKLYGGTLKLTSMPGAGTTFEITLPAARENFASGQVIESEQHISLPGAAGDPVMVGAVFEADRDETEESLLPGRDSVLVAEDNDDLLNFFSGVLGQEFTVIPAKDGEEAFRLTLRYVPSLVLSDLMMPKLDGIQLAEKIREDERTSHIPVVLLTAKSDHETRLAGLKTGADDYITKPFSTEELVVRISNLIAQRKKLAERFRERVLVPASPTTQHSLDDRFLFKVRGVVEENLSDFTFTVEQLAEEINLSRTQLLRKLKALTGLSPNEFIKDMRLKAAAEMISKRVDTITQIGYAVGFNDQSYFTKCFKKQFGLTPTEYSQKQSLSV